MAVSSRQVQNKLDGNGALTGKSGTVYDVNIKYTAPDGASLGLSMNFEAVTARYVDVRLERKKEVLDAYHGALDNAIPAAAKESETPKRGKAQARKRATKWSYNGRISLLLSVASYMSAQNVGTIWAPF